MERETGISDLSPARGRICGCVLDCSSGEFPEWLSYSGIDMVEWRIDRFTGRFAQDSPESFYRALSGRSRHAVIATNRPPREMGAFEGPEQARLGMLEEAAKAGAEWIDLELDVAEQGIARFREPGSKVLVSNHNPATTPSGKDLRELLEKMSRTGADALKIVTFARSVEDSLRVLELIPIARRDFATDLIAFCMGPAGKLSRVACVLLGSPWTYARLPGHPGAAPGQLSAAEIRAAMDILDRT